MAARIPIWKFEVVSVLPPKLSSKMEAFCGFVIIKVEMDPVFLS